MILSALTRDVRYGVRALRKTPAFTLGAITTVALTVGATTAIFSVVYGVLLRQLPYRDVERVFWMWSDQPNGGRAPFNVPDFIDYRDSIRALSGFAGFFAASANLTDGASAERLQGMRATGNLFDVLGAQARTGRLLDPGDERPGADRVVVLGDSLWRRRFGGDAGIVGRAIRLNGEMHTVVGVLSGDFVMPIRDVEFVLPFAPDQDPRRGARNSFNFIIGAGRLGDRISPSQAASDLNAFARRLRAQYPVENARKQGVRLVPAIEGIAGQFRTALVTLFAAVAAVQLIACANLANLLLTRAIGRRRDVAVQLALGSSRSRVVGQVLIEALLVSVAGGGVGVLLALWGAAGLVALAPAALPRSSEIHVDVTVLMFSMALSGTTGVLFGVIPALTSARVDVSDALRESTRGSTAASHGVRGLLVGAEVALAVVLLVVMTMLAKSFAQVQAVDVKFDPARVLSARLTLPATRFKTRDAIVNFQRALGERLTALPGVDKAGAISLLPLSGMLARVPFTVEGRAIEREKVPVAQYRVVTPDYFDTARVPLKRGRPFSPLDTADGQAVALVNEELARVWLEGIEPVGARLLVDDSDGPPRPIEIVGVVGNARQLTLDGEPTWDLYITYAQVHADNVAAAAANMFWIVRTIGEPMSVATNFAREVRRIDPDVAASQIRPMDAYLSDAIAPRRFSLSLMTIFGCAALALAVTGIYAVVVYSTSQRTREIAIRIALGATRANIVRLVMGQGLRAAAAGLVVGTAGAVGLMRLLSAMLFGVSATDTTAFAQVAVVVAAASTIASAVPALRATKAFSRG